MRTVGAAAVMPTDQERGGQEEQQAQTTSQSRCDTLRLHAEAERTAAQRLGERPCDGIRSAKSEPQRSSSQHVQKPPDFDIVR